MWRIILPYIKYLQIFTDDTNGPLYNWHIGHKYWWIVLWCIKCYITPIFYFFSWGGGVGGRQDVKFVCPGAWNRRGWSVLPVKKQRSGCFLCEQMFHYAAWHQAESRWAWQGDAADVQHVVHGLRAVGPAGLTVTVCGLIASSLCFLGPQSCSQIPMKTLETEVRLEMRVNVQPLPFFIQVRSAKSRTEKLTDEQKWERRSGLCCRLVAGRTNWSLNMILFWSCCNKWTDYYSFESI